MANKTLKKKDKFSHRWSDEDNWKNDKGKKVKKPIATDDVIIDDPVIIDVPVKCKSLKSSKRIFYIKGGSLEVNGKRKA